MTRIEPMLFDYHTSESLVPQALSPDSPTEGACRGVVIRPGFELILADVHYGSEAAYRHECSASVKFHYKLSGDSFISGEDGNHVGVDANRMSFLVVPTDSTKRSWMPANTHERSVTLVCNKEFASSIFCDRKCSLPTSIEEFCWATPSRFCYTSTFLPAQMRTIVRDLLGLPDTGAMAMLMLESKALELLYLTCKHLQSYPATAAIKPRDQKRVSELCEILASPAGGKLSIAQLCRHFAWNEKQMLECFKAVTGTTISSYRNRAQMENALRQLQAGDASITEIALNAGYEHPSNFATAFKRTFGFTPRLARGSSATE